MRGIFWEEVEVGGNSEWLAKRGRTSEESSAVMFALGALPFTRAFMRHAVPCCASLSDNERNKMRELVLSCYVHSSVRLPAGIGGSSRGRRTSLIFLFDAFPRFSPFYSLIIRALSPPWRFSFVRRVDESQDFSTIRSYTRGTVKIVLREVKLEDSSNFNL